MEPQVYRLKVGTTADPRLDRIHQPDERNSGFPIRALLTAEQERKERGYSWYCPWTTNQYQEGACVEHSIVQEMGCRPVMVSFDVVKSIVATHGIYWPAQQEDPWEGGSWPGAQPFYEGTSLLSGIKVAARLGFYDEYRWAFDVHDLALAIGYKGPAVLGINWYEGMFDPDGDGYVRVGGDIAGGHAILCNGVNVRAKRFRIHNSWGDAWGWRDSNGVGGNAWVSYEDMERLLSEDGEACIPISRKR